MKLIWLKKSLDEDCFEILSDLGISLQFVIIEYFIDNSEKLINNSDVAISNRSSPNRRSTSNSHIKEIEDYIKKKKFIKQP